MLQFLSKLCCLFLLNNLTNQKSQTLKFDNNCVVKNHVTVNHITMNHVTIFVKIMSFFSAEQSDKSENSNLKICIIIALSRFFCSVVNSFTHCIPCSFQGKNGSCEISTTDDS